MTIVAPALTIINGVSRLLPGTLGDPSSLNDESHNSSLLEYPHYTRPKNFRNMKVPDVLMSGNHMQIENWREQQKLKRTKIRREDLLQKNNFHDDNPSNPEEKWFWDL